MKKIFLFSLLTLAILGFENCGKKTYPPVTIPYGVIYDNMDSAKTLAGSADKNIFLMFHAAWCNACFNFKTNVLNNADTKALLENKIVISLVEGDLTYGKPYAEQFNVTGYPTYVVLDKNGNTLIRKTGGMSAETFTQWITPYLK